MIKPIKPVQKIFEERKKAIENEFPDIKIKTAEVISDKWVSCSYCGEVWEETTDLGVIICPKNKERNNNVDPLSNEYPSTSPYTYVLNNPLKLIDPTGMYDLSAIEDEDLRREVSLAIKNAFDDLYARDEEGNAKIDKVYAHYGANTNFAKKAIDKILGIIFTDGSGPKVMIGDVEGGNAETLNDITSVTDDSGNITDISGTVMIDPKADPVRVLTGPYIGAGIKTTGRTMLSRTLLHEGFHVTDEVLGIKQSISSTLGRDKFDELGIELHGYTNSYFGLTKRLRKDEAFYRKKKRGY